MKEQIKITYMEHSAFVVELADKTLVFDYTKGEPPQINESNPVYIFASHGHYDHYQNEIFSLYPKASQKTYILSDDIRLGELEAAAVDQYDILAVAPEAEYQVADLIIRTLTSTDLGVAFLIKTAGTTLYFAGDLNWWHWRGEPEAWNRQMELDYKAQIASLKEEAITVAFLPLDGRQEAYYAAGFDYFMKHVQVQYAVPMHMWENYEVVEQLKQEACSVSYRTKIVDIMHPMQIVELNREAE